MVEETHICNSCAFDFPTCSAIDDDVQFGSKASYPYTGDNVIGCKCYKKANKVTQNNHKE